MIIYDLDCENGHRFEGWFRSAQDFDDQLSRKLVSCPQCDSQQVRRIPSAVAIGSHETAVAPSAESAGLPTLPATALMSGGPEVLAIYRQLVAAIVANTEDVGSSFASEARKIHYNEAPERPIRGQATVDEFDALKDEGIEVLSLPIIKDDELN